jgi:hypothetical protein
MTTKQLNIVTRKTSKTPRSRILRLSYEDAALVVDWLNEAHGTDAYIRVIELRPEIGEVLRIINDLHHRKRVRQNDWKSLRERYFALMRRLARYKSVPGFDFNFARDAWRFETVSANSPLVTGVSTSSLPKEYGEYHVIMALGRLANAHKLDMVRQCEWCGERWLVSARALDRFCSTPCRNQWHLKDPKSIRLNRERQQRYRNKP